MQRLRTWQLFTAGVLIWGTTWHAIVHQVAYSTPEVGVTLRFGLAGLLVLAGCAWRGQWPRIGWAGHAYLALQGALMYSLSYLCVYHAERLVPSGLVAVGYSAAPLVSGVGARLLWGLALTRRFIAGGLLGVLGVALIFLPEVAQVGGSSGAPLGAALTVAAVLLSAAGGLAAHSNPRLGLPFWPAFGHAMLYGALLSLVVLKVQGQSITIPSAPAWWLSLLYLAVAGSVVAFACFLTLQQRIGPGRASTLGVMTPLLAIALSTAFEGYHPGAWTLAGMTLALIGNILMLRRDADA